MIEALSTVVVFFLIFVGLKMFKGFCCYGYGSEDGCSGKAPFYVIFISSKEKVEDINNQIENLITKNAHVVIAVNDADIDSEYTQKVKDIVKSLLSRCLSYHPVLVFKTSEAYQNFFLEDFEDVCVYEDFESPEDFFVRDCPCINQT